MDYFSFYKIPISFQIDAKALKKIYLKNSRAYHPDFHTGADEDEQSRMLELSTLNNEAYKTLKNSDARLKYILELKKVYVDGDSAGNKLPPDFLMEMMEINEALMELEFDFDANVLEKVRNEIQNFEENLYNSVQPILDSYDGSSQMDKELEQVKIFFLKQRYLLRIKEKLSTFAPA